VLRYLETRPTASGRDIGLYVSATYGQPWNPASQTRNGNALRMWALWVAKGQHKGTIPRPLGPRTSKPVTRTKQERLFP
jgi:hypothetical protein